MSRIFKVLIFISGLAAVVLIAAALYLSSEAFNRFAQSKLTIFLESRFQTRASFGNIDISLWQGQIEIDDLRLESRLYPAPEPAIAVRRALVDFSILRYWLTGIHLDEVILDGLRLNLRQDPNHRFNLANMFGSPDPKPEGDKGFSPLKVAISSVQLDDAVVTYEDQEVSFSSSSAGFALSLSYLPAPPAYSGDIDLRGFTFSAGDFPVPVTDFSSHFVVQDHLVRFEKATVRSDQLAGSLEGAILNFKPFEYAFSVDLSTDLPRFTEPDLAAVFDAGKVRLLGRVTGTGGDVDFRGRLTSDLLEFKGIRLTGVDGAVRVGRDGATLEATKFSVFDGSGQADAEIFWSAERESSAHVAARGMRLFPVLQLVGGGDLPVRAVNRIVADVQWPGVRFEEISGPAELEFNGRLTPGAATEAGDLPFSGRTHAILSEGGVAFDRGTATTSTSEISFSGELSFKGDLELVAGLDSSSGREAWSIADRFGALPADLLAEYPIEPDGRLKGQVNLSRPAGGIVTLNAEVDVDSTVFRGVPVGSTRARVSLTDSELQVRQLEIRQGDRFLSGSLQFNREPFKLEAISARVTAFPLKLLAETGFVQSSLDLKGLVSGSARFVIDEEEGYSGLAQATVIDAEAFGETIPRASAKIQAAGSTFRATEASAQAWGADLTGRASVDLDKRSFEFRLSGSGLTVDQVNGIPADLQASGTCMVQLRGSGTFEDPQVDLTLRSDDITITSERFESIELQAHYEPEAASLEGSARYMNQGFHLQASVEPREPYAFTASAELPEIEMSPILEHFIDRPLTDFSGKVAGAVRAEGNLSDLKNSKLSGQFPTLEFAVSDYLVRAPEPWTFGYESQLITIRSGRLKGPDTDLNLGGTINLSESQLNLKITGTADLKAANAFIKDGRVAGEVSLEIDVGGPMGDPRFVGTADLSQVSLSYPGLPTAVRAGSGMIRFTSSQISIESFSAQTQYGSVEVNGGLFIDELVPTRWQINISGYGLVLEYPEGFSTTLDADIDYLKGEDSELISGAVYIRSSEYTRDISIAELILSLSESNGNGSPAGSADTDIALDLTVEAYHSLRINNNLAEVVASADFSIVGTTVNPIVLGSLTVDDGTLRLEGNEYEFTRGTVNFNNPRKTTPYLNLEVETQVREYNIGIVMRGPIDQFQLSFRSEPPLSTASIVSLLAAGQTEEEILGVEPGGQSKSSALAAYGAGTLLGKTLGIAMGGQASRLFGIDRFSVDPFISDSRSRDPGARITLGKQITREFNVTYISSLANSFQEQTVIIQYRLTDWVTAVGTSQTDGTVAVDFKFRKRF